MSLSGLAWLAVCLSAASSRRTEDYYRRMIIDEDNLFTTFLYPGRAVNLFYLLQRDKVDVLSFTVTPCTAPVAWDIGFRNSTDTGRVEMGSRPVNRPAERKPDARVLTPAFRGLYTVQLSADEESWVQLYITFLGKPRELWPTAVPHVVHRRAHGQVFVRWRQTTVDPDDTEYVVVLHRGEEPVESLCRAGGLLSGVERPQEWIPPQNSSSTVRPTRRRDIVMERLGKRTNWLARGLDGKERYHIEVFAVNTATNFSYRYAFAANVTYRRPRPILLQDGRQVVAELRRAEPRAAFRYKVREAEKTLLEVGVTVCGSGGTVLAELRQKGSAVGDKATITGHGVLAVANPPQGAAFVLRLRLPPAFRNTQVQVNATTKGLEEPVLPELAVVHEYKGLRGCSQVVLGWVPVKGEALYCIIATQVKRKDVFYRLPDQCAVEHNLNSIEYSVLQCSQILPTENQTVITEQITNLKPGKQYDIQVSVKKGNAKALSYELIRVRTKNACK